MWLLILPLDGRGWETHASHGPKPCDFPYESFINHPSQPSHCYLFLSGEPQNLGNHHGEPTPTRYGYGLTPLAFALPTWDHTKNVTPKFTACWQKNVDGTEIVVITQWQLKSLWTVIARWLMMPWIPRKVRLIPCSSPSAGHALASLFHRWSVEIWSSLQLSWGWQKHLQMSNFCHEAKEQHPA